MDWEANLAAIIKCTDANLQQQFRQFEDLSAEFAADSAAPEPTDNVAHSYLRESMAADYRHRQQSQRDQQAPSYSRVSSAIQRGAEPTPGTSFSEHFHRRQEHKRAAKDNQRVHHSKQQEFAAMEAQEQEPDQYEERRYPRSGGGFQAYASPSYDVAQMMEQVRLSLKLEVDARAAIAERQLSALLQLCKSTSEELDRLRVEVCANDRQLHTLDQVQSKIRQELTTQKDIGFHLQSMCGKDESWRMQTENQLLELRQMVAALREQGNSTQAVAQEKLSRSELLVQFNAAMEPIKAQLQANLQHQAQQIAEITRTSSSSTLLLDNLAQKVNRGMAEEISELRSDLSALKHHVAKMDIFQDQREGQQHARVPQPPKEEVEAKEKEEQRLQEKRMAGLREEILKDLTAVTKDYVDTQARLLRQAVDECSSKYSLKKEVEAVQRVVGEDCKSRCSAVVAQLETRAKSLQDKSRGECIAASRDVFDRMERSVQQSMNNVTTALEGQSNSWQVKLQDLVKKVEMEQKEHKVAMDELQEALRKSRHQLEDQIHSLTQESRCKLSQHETNVERRIKDVESHAEKSIEACRGSVKTQSDNNDAEWEQKLKRLEESLAETNISIAQLSKTMTTSRAPTPKNETSPKESSSAFEKQTNAYVSTMESLLNKMQVHLQLQTQSQPQMVMAQSPYHGFWPSSPYAHPPTLQLPPVMATLTTASAVESTTITTATTAESNKSDNVKPAGSVETTKPKATSLEEGKPAGLPGDAVLVQSTVQLNAPQSESPLESSPLLLTAKPVENATSLQRNEDSRDSKRESTIAATAKGALAEAELAKARVENRRKLEMESKQQQLERSNQTPAAQSVLGKNALEDAESRRSFVAGATATPTTSTTTLVRTASSSALPGNNADRHNGESTAASSRSFSSTQVLSGHPPQPMAKNSELTSPTQAPGLINRDTKPNNNSPPPAPLAPTDRPEAQKNEATAIYPTPNDEQQNAIKLPDQAPLSTTPPTQPKSTTTKEEIPPPLSPLAKIFAQRSTNAAEDGAWSRATQNLVSEEIASSSKTLEIVEAQVAVPTTSVPAIPACSNPVSHVLCGLCRLPVRSDQKAEHEKSLCPKRIMQCPNCKKEMQWAGLATHELNCETYSSTDTREDATTLTGGSLKKCRHCSIDIPSLELLEHEINCDKVLKQCPHCLRRQKMSELQEHIENCDCRLVSCPNECGGKFLQRGIPNHMATRCPKKSLTTTTAAPAPPQVPHPEAAKPVSTLSTKTQSTSEKVECKFCDDEIDSSNIEAHEQTCDWRPKRCQHCNMVVISRDLVRHETSCKTNLRSCPHCNENMPQSALATHISRCSKRPIKCVRCCQLFSADTIVAHSTCCKSIPASTIGNAASTQLSLASFGLQQASARAPIKIPPPPPFPPPSSAESTQAPPANARRATADPRTGGSSTATDETASDRLARRNLALSQLTNPGAVNATGRASAPSFQTGNLGIRPGVVDDHKEEDEDDYEDDEDDDEDDGQLTLAQVVKEWNVENVCLWLHEDVGVPEVVTRFHQKQCNGEMLLELTESDLINDFGINNRVHRERILHAIEAIQTSDAYSDDEEEEDEEEEEEDGDDFETSEPPTTQSRHSMGGGLTHPRDLLRRKSQPSPQRDLGSLPSSNDMFRRINKALENPKR